MHDHATTVDHHQRIAGADAAHVDACNVTARTVGSGVGVFEFEVTDRRHVGKNVLHVDGAEILDRLFAQHRDRQGFFRQALDVGARYDDFFYFFVCLILLCAGRKGQQHDEWQQPRYVGNSRV